MKINVAKQILDMTSRFERCSFGHVEIDQTTGAKDMTPQEEREFNEDDMIVYTLGNRFRGFPEFIITARDSLIRERMAGMEGYQIIEQILDMVLKSSIAFAHGDTVLLTMPSPDAPNDPNRELLMAIKLRPVQKGQSDILVFDTEGNDDPKNYGTEDNPIVGPWDYGIYQLLLTDDNGKFPDQKGYSADPKFRQFLFEKAE